MLKFGPWVLSPHQYLLSSGKIERELDPLTCKLLHYFLTHGKTLISREDLAKHVWETPYVDDNAIYRAISDLRKQLTHPDFSHKFIKTHHKKGYSFPIEVIKLPEKSVHEAPPSTPTTTPEAQKILPSVAKRTRTVPVFLSALLLLLVSILWLLISHGETGPSQPPEPAPNSMTHAPSITWEPGAEYNPLLSSDNRYLAYRNHLNGTDTSFIVRQSDKMKVPLFYQDKHIDVLSWQADSDTLLTAISDDEHCQIATFDISQFPHILAPTMLLPCGRPLNNAAYLSQDGKDLYYVKAIRGLQKNTIYRYSLETGQEQELLAKHEVNGGVLHFEMSPDETHLAYLLVDFKGPMRAGLLTLTTGKNQLIAQLKHAPYGFAIDWLHDSSAVLIADKNRISTIDIATQATTTARLPDNFYAYYLELAENNHILYTPYVVRHASLIKATNIFSAYDTVHTPIYQSDMHNYNVGSAHSGAVYFASTRTGTHEVWRAQDNELTQLSDLKDIDQYIGPIRESYDGKYILFKQSEKLKFIRLSDNQLFTIPELPEKICRYYWTPTGNHIIYSTEDTEHSKIWQFDLITRSIHLLSEVGGRSLLVNELGAAYYLDENNLVSVATGDAQALNLPSYNHNFSVLTSQYLYFHDAIKSLYRLDLKTNELLKETLLFAPGEMATMSINNGLIYTRYQLSDTSIKYSSHPFTLHADAL